MLSGPRVRTLALLALLGATLTHGATASARTIVVSDSIQAAVDAAQPGDVVLVPPGLYRETVLVDKDDITILGPRSAVLDARGFENGIRVGTGEIVRDDDDVPRCPAPDIHGFRLIGLTIQNADENGVFLIGVDGFKILGGRYVDNYEYGPFPICSRHGFIGYVEATGHKDAAIYLGDDDDVQVIKNYVHGNAIGIEIENSTNAEVRHNWVTGNTTGILVVVLPGLPFPFTENVTVRNNWVIRNNLPNPIPVDSGNPVGLLPTGTGILNVGGDAVLIHENLVLRNDSVGIALVPTLLGALDPRVDPFPDGNQVVRNLALGNGRNPDPLRLTTGPADLVYVPDLIDPVTGELVAQDPDPDNCFARNVFRTDFPDDITRLFPCR